MSVSVRFLIIELIVSPEAPQTMPILPVETLADEEFYDVEAEVVPEELVERGTEWIDAPLPLQADYPWCPVPWRHPLGSLWWLIRTLFSLVSLILLLAIVAAIPILNFIALGYLLEVEARVARSGRLVAAFPLLNQAARLGAIVACIWITLIPLRLISSYAADAMLIDPRSPTTIRLQIMVQFVLVLTTLHILFALSRGGSIGCFVRPVKNIRWLIGQVSGGNYLKTAGRNVQEFAEKIQLRGLFMQGLRGFIVALAWLFIPTVCYAALRRPEGLPVVIMVLGAFLLTIALMWAPFLQAQYAATGRFRAGFQLRTIRSLWQSAPVAWTLALIFLYLLALPLYLFKAVALPQDAMWLMTLVFVATIYPTRIFTGWAYGRAVRRRELGIRAPWFVRALCGTILFPLMGIFVFILFFTQFLGAEGRLVLFAHHALLLPAPFFLFIR